MHLSHRLRRTNPLNVGFGLRRNPVLQAPDMKTIVSQHGAFFPFSRSCSLPASSISVCLAHSKHFLHNFSFFSDNFFELSENGSENILKSQRLVREEAEGKVTRENEPVLLVLSVCDGEIILEKGKILSEKRHFEWSLAASLASRAGCRKSLQNTRLPILSEVVASAATARAESGANPVVRWSATTSVA